MVGRMWGKSPASGAVIVAELPPVQNYFTRGGNANEQMLQLNSITCSVSVREVGVDVAALAFVGSVSVPGKSKRNELTKLCR